MVIIYGEVKLTKKARCLKKIIIINNNLWLYNQNYQTPLDPSLVTFSAIDHTLSDPSIFIESNWRIYKDPFDSDHYPIIMKNTIVENSKPQTIPKQLMKFKKKTNMKSYKILYLTSLIPETNTNQEEPIMHFTNILINIANKTMPMVHSGMQRYKRVSKQTSHQKI